MCVVCDRLGVWWEGSDIGVNDDLVLFDLLFVIYFIDRWCFVCFIDMKFCIIINCGYVFCGMFFFEFFYIYVWLYYYGNIIVW